ncbi:MAG: apolipoprotein N-acyltransferase [Actinomycetes bacterium]|jgi:apolipoprotein N-acyltransferase
MKLPRRFVHSGSVIAGLCIAFAMPPWGWWPFAFIGLGIFYTVSGKRTSAQQAFSSGFSLGLGWFLPTLAWMWYISIPGYFLTVVFFSCLHGIAELLIFSREPRRYLQPIAHMLVEALRFSWPFGGAPIATLAMTQSNTWFASFGRIGGALLVSYLLWQFAVILFSRFRLVLPCIAAGVLLLAIAPTGNSFASKTQVRIAYVQGGGPQGTRASNTSPRNVVLRHLTATKSLSPDQKIDVVIWPENIVDVPIFNTSREAKEIAQEAKRINAPISVGVTDDVPPDNFANAQVVVTPAGDIIDRYEKVRRVPFGEFIPMRGFLKSIGAPVHQVRHDAIKGKTPAISVIPLSHPTISGETLPFVSFATPVSWEIFFGGRVNEGVERGASIIKNPTNGSSYRGTLLQSQQIASSQLRAIEFGRTVVQVAPTGFSAFISPSGEVSQRSKVSERRIEIADIELRTGRTWYSFLGDSPIIISLLIGFAFLLMRHQRKSRIHTSG